MFTRRQFVPSLAGLVSSLPFALARAEATDSRNIASGFALPRENYSDQPYVVITSDGNWLCVLTTGKGTEGKPGQHIISTISRDKGRTWSDPVPIEPATGPEASWVMPLRVPSGRVYVFYDYNQERLTEIPGCSDASISHRMDTLGSYMFKYSDDNGRSWSEKRYPIPMRRMRIDRENNFQGRTLQFWGVGKPIVNGQDVFFGFAKVGKQCLPGTFVRSQGCLMHSANILTERDPAKIRWETLPEGDEGLRAPKGPIAEETNLTWLSNGSLYAVYRTIDGYLCHAYSHDRGRTWTGPEYATYTPGGRPIKNPRAFAFVRRFSNGKYLLWYHNHGGEAVHLKRWDYYKERNPGWVAGGVEIAGRMHWSEPEILLYDEDPAARISYPDFVEDNGRYFITETQKELARVHEINPDLLNGVWNQLENHSLCTEGLLTSWKGADLRPDAKVRMPRLAPLSQRKGFTIDCWVRFRELSPGQVLLDTRGGAKPGIWMGISDRFTLEFRMSDGHTEAVWDTDPGTGPGTLKVGRWTHIGLTVDAGPRLILFMVDGVLNDGGCLRQYGWSRFVSDLDDINGSADASVSSNMQGELREMRIYGRPLRTLELVGNFRRG